MMVPFNSPLEIGVRSLTILTMVFPKSLDIQYLVFLDYLTIHSGDVDGPASLHTSLPLRSGELAIRRQLIERGLLLMASRDLVKQLALSDGFHYQASEEANAFLSKLSSPYMTKLQSRASWVEQTFGQSSIEELHVMERKFLREWSTQFQGVHRIRENSI